MRKAKPTGSQFAGHTAYAPRRLVPYLLSVDDFAGLRQRALFTLRAVSLIRAASVHSLSRSSLREDVDLIDRPIVVFTCGSKGATAAGMAQDMNYVEHFSVCTRSSSVSDLCPACLLLRLKQAVDSLPLAATHDHLFTAADGSPLSTQRLSKIITELISSAGLSSVFKSHSLRNASNQTLIVLGVPFPDINVRAAWHSRADNATASFHYTHNRFVRHNFADLLLLPSIFSIDASSKSNSIVIERSEDVDTLDLQKH